MHSKPVIRKKRLLKQNISTFGPKAEVAGKDVLNAVAPGPRIDPNVAFIHLLDENVRDQVAVIPAEHVSLHALHIPVRSARQRLAALPFAVEDRVARALEQDHFAVLGTTARGETLAAIVDGALMGLWVEQTADKTLIAEQMLIPPADIRDDERPVWRVYRQSERALVRVSDGTGFATLPGMLEALWQIAGKPVVESYGAALEGDIPSTQLPLDGLAVSHSFAAQDLRQGRYQPSRGLARPLRFLAASVALAALAHIALMFADTRAQRTIADDLRTQADAALATSLPTASADDQPGLILRQISALNQPQRGSSFLPMMERVAQALAQQPQEIQFRQLNWSEDALRLGVEAANLDVLQEAQASLQGSGLQVSSGSATTEGGAARVDLTVRQ